LEIRDSLLRRRWPFELGFILVLLRLIWSGNVLAQSSPNAHARVELIADDSPLQGKAIIGVGLLFRLDRGWHIYWKNPGDSGEPPRITWELPPGLRAGEIRWPQPIRLGSGSVVDYGYENEVLLAAPIERSEGAPVSSTTTIAAAVKYVVCREICIPGKAHLTLPLSATGLAEGQKSQWHALFEQTKVQIPKAAPAGWKVAADSNNENFILSVRTGRRMDSATFFPLESGEIDNSAAQVFAPNKDGFQLTLRKSDQLNKPLSNLRGLIVLGPGRAFEIAARVVGSPR
jgi:DsbC/DsbD-like thiol-disulfide interchange protein